MAALSHLPRPLRRAAVAAVLLTGCVASIATQPAVVECTEPAGTEVSDFYGPQDDDTGESGLAQPHELTAHGYTLRSVSVSVGGCVAEGTPVRVFVSMDFTQDGTGGAPHDVFPSFEVRDATGSTWRDPEPGIVEARPATANTPASPASAHLRFDLPLDVQEPVVLLLGDLATEELDRLVLEPAGPGEAE